MSSANRYFLKVIDGPDRGAIFQIFPPSIQIGRATDCDVILKDPRSSRISARINISDNDISIINVSENHPLLLNTLKVDQSTLQHGDIFTIGNTRISFIIKDPRALNSKKKTKRPAKPLPRNTSSSLPILIFVGLLFIISIAIMKTDNELDLPQIRSVEEIEREIEQISQGSKNRKPASREERIRQREAHSHYLQGFRDYQKGQYSRAILAFETTRAINPNHELAIRYQLLSRQRMDELINKWTLEGSSYRQKNMFSRCISAYSKIIDFVDDDSDIRLREAKAMKNDCLRRKRENQPF